MESLRINFRLDRKPKKNKEATNCILELDTPETIANALQETAVEDIWGVGFSYSEKLKVYGINTAYTLSIKDLSWGKKFLGGVVGMRLIRELKGFKSHSMQAPRTEKKMIAITPTNKALKMRRNSRSL